MLHGKKVAKNSEQAAKEAFSGNTLGSNLPSVNIQSNKIGHCEIDSRPSDALAIALRMHAPILVSKEIMNEAIILEKDLQNVEDEIEQEPMIETLEKQLQKAIDEEEYEVAARIRDKIKNI